MEMDHSRWARIQELYAAASEQPESERSCFLSLACDGDEALEREVKTLLDQPTSTGQFVEFVGGPPAARHNFSGRQHGGAIVGTSPDTYVFTKTEFHTNLFRIPLKK
jgi:hypothetical protein